jgi:uncharacterized protein (DUF433 family)
MELQETEREAVEHTEWMASGVAITRHPGRCGGAPTISGSRIGVHQVVARAQHYDGDPTQLQAREFPDLSLAEVEAALDYAREHAEEIAATLHRDQTFLQQLPRVPMGPKARR